MISSYHSSIIDLDNTQSLWGRETICYLLSWKSLSYSNREARPEYRLGKTNSYIFIDYTINGYFQD